MKQNKIEILATELGEALGDTLLHFCSISEVNRFKKEFDLEKIEDAEQEYFYLLMFLTTYACQIAFINNQKIVKIILDSFHDYMSRNKLDLPLRVPDDQQVKEKLRERYAHYYELSRTKEHNIDIGFLSRQLPYNFFANVLKKDLNYIFNDKAFRERWGKSTIKLSLFVGEVLTETAIAINRIKDKYKIED
jgi:hypothetical protein